MIPCKFPGGCRYLTRNEGMWKFFEPELQKRIYELGSINGCREAMENV